MQTTDRQIEEMTVGASNDLREWCAKAHSMAEKAKLLCKFEGCDSLEDFRAITNTIDSLLARTERPEIRILIIGPLKSGKSTLMNVLLDNPLLSQISQWPAYPCFTEVRDVERDPKGLPTNVPRAIFHRSDEAAPEVCELSTSHERLGVFARQVHRGWRRRDSRLSAGGATGRPARLRKWCGSSRTRYRCGGFSGVVLPACCGSATVWTTTQSHIYRRIRYNLLGRHRKPISAV